MTAAAATLDEPAERDVPPRAWARLVELAMVGPGALLLFPLSWLLRRATDLDTAELAVGFTMFHLAHLVNDPHFAVTYLLFYRDARARVRDRETPLAQRARYVFAGAVVPIALVAWAAIALALRSHQSLGWMVQLMFLLVGWHYAKQGFGVLMVLSARRGARWSARERAIVLAHCFAAWAFAWASPASEAGLFEEKGVVYWAPARPPLLELVTGVVLAVSSVALVAVLALKWRRERALPFAPLLAFLVTIWLFTIFTSLDPLVRYAIPALHGVQYLYFVGLLRRNEARAREGPPTFGPPVRTRLVMLALGAIGLGWLLFRGAPAVLDAWLVPAWRTTREDLGATPFVAAFFVVVNLHHYFMDTVIWRRENPDTAWLHRDPPRAPAEA